MSYQYSEFSASLWHSSARIVVAILMLGIVSVAPAGLTFADDDNSTNEAVQQQNEANTQDAGTNGEQGSVADGDSSVTTGDAIAGTDVDNQINTNTVDTASTTTPDDSPAADAVDTSSSTQTDGADTADTGQEQEHVSEVLNTEGSEGVGTTTLSIDTENTATTTTTAVSTAQTGENEASSGDGAATIDSGDSYAFMNVANLVNTNFVGSNGSFQLLNLFGTIFGELSLTMENGAGCSFLCFLTELFVSSFNTAYVENNIAVEASTGLNMATSTNGDAGITTGNAFAAANVINMINTNVVGSDYLAFIMNAFGSWEGDLVLPPGSFFESWQGEQCCANGAVTAENENAADIQNNVGADAASGGNSAEGGDATTVTTGNAAAASNVMTIANTNIFGNNLLLMYVRTGGRWSGRIFSLPSGVNIIGMDDGFIIDGFSSQFAGNSIGFGMGSTSIQNRSNARIINNVSATAFTGGNAAHAGGNALLSTGNAFAAANVMNIANTNIIGKNWLLAIVNVFGNWMGDLAFGRPDLWVGASAEGPSPLSDGARVEFTVTYRNNGNAPATESEISFDFGENLRITNPNGGTVNAEAGTIAFNAGTVNPGAYGSFSFAAEVQSAPSGDSRSRVFAAADMYEDDGNAGNNTDELLLQLYKKPPEGFLGYHQIYARLEIKKERAGTDSVYPGEEVGYKITVENKGAGYAYNVHVEDEMRNISSTVVSAQGWDLQTMLPGEKVIIDYTISFATGTPAGVYENKALAMWHDENGNYVDHSGHSAASVEVVLPEEPEQVSASGGGNVALSPLDTTSGGVIDGSSDTATPPSEVIVESDSESEITTVTSQEHPDDSSSVVIQDAQHLVYVKDTRPLDADLRDELERSHFNPWDPRNLLASISLSGIGYSIVWTMFAALVIYLTTRKRLA